MKTIFNYLAVILLLMTTAMGFTACSDDDDDDEKVANEDKKTELLSSAINQYINSVVYPTYTSLASASLELFDDVSLLKTKLSSGTLTQSDIDATCEKFLEARAYWEKSEAWLYGPAEYFGIDPHIDTWPLDKTGLANFFSTNYTYLASLDEEAAIEYVSSVNDETAFLGFHGLEYILFRDGENRTVADFQGYETDSEFSAANPNVTGEMELTFAIAVAGDLRDHCCWLEVSWMGTSAASSHQARCTTRGFELLIDGQYTGYAMLHLNSTELYTTERGTIGTILDAGCMNIAQEVSDQKMGQVYRTASKGVEEEGEDSRDYIESPYSQKSFQDFYDNIVSIKNSLYGNLDGSTYSSNSIMAYLHTYNSSMATSLENALQNSFDALNVCLKGVPFVTIANTANASDLANVKSAMDAIDDLNDTLNEAKEWIQKN